MVSMSSLQSSHIAALAHTNPMVMTTAIHSCKPDRSSLNGFEGQRTIIQPQLPDYESAGV